MKPFANLILSMLAILCPATAAAQKDYTEEKALITKVKRAPATYMFAEATCRTEEEAQSVAEEMFLENINEYVASQKKLRGSSNIVINNQKGLQQTVTMPRGSNMYRVFMYVKKSDIIPSDNTVVLSRESSPKKTDETNTAAATSSVTDINAGKESGDETTKKPDTGEAKKPETEAAKKVDTMETPAESEAAGRPMPDAIKQLSSLTRIQDVAAWLKKMKEQGVVSDYNKYNAIADKTAYWLVIYDSTGAVAAVLSDGAQRHNAATGKPDHERNYRNCAALCIRLADK